MDDIQKGYDEGEKLKKDKKIKIQTLLNWIEFLNQFGEMLKKRYLDFETGIFYHFLVIKMIFLVIKSYQNFLDEDWDF